MTRRERWALGLIAISAVLGLAGLAVVCLVPWSRGEDTVAALWTLGSIACGTGTWNAPRQSRQTRRTPPTT